MYNISKKSIISLCCLGLFFCSAKAVPNLSWYKFPFAAGFAAAYAQAYFKDKLAQESSTQIPPYTINLMWINKDLKPEESYAIQPKNTRVTQEYISAPCIWAIKNPESTVQFWFDSKFTSPDALEQTKKAIANRMQSCPHSAPIVFKDIRDLQHVKDHPEIFSAKTPVYFRADLARVIAGYEEAKNKQNNFVYADFDVEPLHKKDLFDATTQERLSKYGMVMAHCDKENYENSFYILSPQEQNMLASLKSTIIDLNTERASRALNGNYVFTKPMTHLQQIVYQSHPLTYAYLYHLQQRGLLKVDPATAYDPNRHGLASFGLEHIKQPLHFEIPGVAANKPNTNDIYSGNKLWIPTKKVKFPPISLDYD